MDKPTAEMDLEKQIADAYEAGLICGIKDGRAAEREEIARWHEEQAERFEKTGGGPIARNHRLDASAIRQRSEASRG